MDAPRDAHSLVAAVDYLNSWLRRAQIDSGKLSSFKLNRRRITARRSWGMTSGDEPGLIDNQRMTTWASRWYRYTEVFRSRRIASVLLLGFASGLPLALTSGTLQAWLTVEGVDIKTIGIFTLVGQAYVFKFLWAPVMDRYAPRFAVLGLLHSAVPGRRRSWLALTQLALAAGIAALGSLSPAHALSALAALAVLVAFCSASQDIVFDAWRTDLLLPAERGAGAAMVTLGYRVAMVVSGGLALWIADRWLGWHAMYWLMAGLMVGALAVTLWLAPDPPASVVVPKTLDEAVFGPLKEFFGRPAALAFLLLIVLYKLGDAFALALTSTFLIRGMGFDPGEVGIVNKSFGLVATILGALIGGTLMAQLGLYRSLLTFGLLQLFSNLAYWVLAVSPKSLLGMAAAVGIENLCGGMGTAAFLALLMALCHREFSATQYALLSALAAVGRVYVGPASGVMVEAWGWPVFYLFSVAMGVPGVALLLGMRKRIVALESKDSSQT
jgi:PAT family beta-lactamase induction signal transducer AmpG